MKRAIKFRGKSATSGKWVYGDLIHLGTGYAIVHNKGLGRSLPDEYGIALAYSESEFDVVLPDTIGQFTGLVDNNGVDIYEGDIAEQEYRFSNLPRTGVVEYSGGRFDYTYVDGYGYDDWQLLLDAVTDEEDFVVIGNIHDNSELLNK